MQGETDFAVTIRPATAADSAAIARVYVASWRSTYAGILSDERLTGMDEARSERRWRIPPSKGYLVLVADSQDEGIVGFASAGPPRFSTPSSQAEVYAIYLHEDHQNRGIGRQLFSRTGAEVAGGASLIVWCLSANPSRYFYERLGGTLAARKLVSFDGIMLEQVAYTWSESARLLS